MKIAYVFQEDAADPAVQSGRPASILRAFESLGVEVERVFPLSTRPAGGRLVKKIGYRLLGKHHRTDRDPGYLSGLATEFAARTQHGAYDLVFCPGSEVVSRMRTDAPVTFCADATFDSLVDYYWDFTGLSHEYLRLGQDQEAAALARAALAVYPSEWAARSAVEHYHADPGRIAVIPFGANHGHDNRRSDVMDWIERRPADHIRLLFVGRHWERKGGDLVVAAALCLIAFGHPVVLDVVGVPVPERHRELPWIRAHGLLSPQHPAQAAQLRRLMAEAHFMVVPSRAEAFGIVFAEACAHGMPAIATRTGGIPAAVRHDHTGMLLPPDARPSDYAEIILAIFRDRGRYRTMCREAYVDFEHRLNWGAFARKFLEAVRERGLIPSASSNLAAAGRVA